VGHGGGGSSRPDAGFSLMEAIVATVIAVIAVMGLAYTFGLGRSFINAFEVRRMADMQAQGCLEWLGSLPGNSSNLAVAPHPAQPFLFSGRPIGSLVWRVAIPTPAEAPAAATSRLRMVSVTVSWTVGGMTDSVMYSRMVGAP
jgi:Tfp pilus assembly protein PilV